MTTLTAFCAVCQAETAHRHRLDHNGEHVIACTAPTSLVRACTACVGGMPHQADDDAALRHGNEEYRAAHIQPDHAVGQPYQGECQAFIKLPSSFAMEDVTAYLEAHRAANDRRALPPPPCVHQFPEVAPRVGDSVCARCGKTHQEIFS